MVLGLPRSSTTWLANWLTTDTTVCLHDPFAHGLPETWESGGKTLGISCTGAYMLPSFMAEQRCPVAVIQRDPEECSKSLAGIGMGPITEAMQRALAKVEARRWKHREIWQDEQARELWSYLLPAVPFDAQRYHLLCEMQIQPHLGKWNPDRQVLNQLLIKEDLLCRGESQQQQ